MALPPRKLLLKRASHKIGRKSAAEEDEIVRGQQYFTRLSVPHLLSGGSEDLKDFRPGFLSSGIDKYVNQCSGLLYFTDLVTGASLIWNPSIKAQRSIPPPTRDVLRTPEVGYTDNCSSCFGYDSGSGALKVLNYFRHVTQVIEGDGIAYDCGPCPCKDQYLLYSTQTNRWVNFPCPGYRYQLENGSVYLNACCFWVNGGEDTVVSFSFSDENFSSFPLNIPTLKFRRDERPIVYCDESDSDDESDSPDESDRDDCYRVIMVEVDEDSTLGFVVYSKSHFQLWTCVINVGSRMPEEDDDGCVVWSKRWEFCVDFPEECDISSLSSDDIDDTDEKVEPLLVYANRKGLLMFMVNNLNDQLMVYSSAAKELKLLPLFSHPDALQLISYHKTTLDPNSF